MRSKVNWLTLSLKILVGKSTLENTSSKASAALSVFWIVSEYGQRNCLRVLCKIKSTIVTIYLLPLSDTGMMGTYQINCNTVKCYIHYWHLPQGNFCNLCYRYSLLICLTWSAKPSYITGDTWAVKTCDPIYCLFAAECPSTIDSWARLITRFLCSDGTISCFLMSEVCPLTFLNSPLCT